jgi:transposase
MLNTTSKLTSISRNSINKIYKHIRIRISEYCEANSVFEVGEIELDESYFGGKMKGKRGRGSMDKIIVLGILKRNDKVYTQIVKNCSIPELLPIIEGNVSKDSVIYTDGFRTYDCLLSYGYKAHHRINP